MLVLLKHHDDPFRIVTCRRTQRRVVNIKAMCITTGHTIALTLTEACASQVFTLRADAVEYAEECRDDNWLTHLHKKTLDESFPASFPEVLIRIICMYSSHEPPESFLPLMEYLVDFQFHFVADCVEMRIAHIDRVDKTQCVEIEYLEFTDPPGWEITVSRSVLIAQNTLWQHFGRANYRFMLNGMPEEITNGKRAPFAFIQLRKSLIAHLAQKLQN